MLDSPRDGFAVANMAKGNWPEGVAIATVICPQMMFAVDMAAAIARLRVPAFVFVGKCKWAQFSFLTYDSVPACASSDFP